MKSVLVHNFKNNVNFTVLVDKKTLICISSGLKDFITPIKPQILDHFQLLEEIDATNIQSLNKEHQNELQTI